MPRPSSPDVLTSKQVAQALGVSRDTVLRMAGAGELAGAWCTLGNHLRVPRASVLDLVHQLRAA